METGVAKMNTVTVATAAEPHMATAVTNNASVLSGNGVHLVTVVTSGYNAGVPTLVTNSMVGGGRTNPAGPQLEEGEDKMEGQMIRGDDTRLNLLNFSPDEHEPLLRREQLPAESEHLAHHQTQAGNILSGRGSNSNNNNNRAALESRVKIQGFEVKPESIIGSQVSLDGGISNSKPEQHLANQQISGSPAARATNTGTCLEKTLIPEPIRVSRNSQNLKAHLDYSEVPGCRDPDSFSTKAQEALVPEAPGNLASQGQEPGPENSTSSSKTTVLPQNLAQKALTTETPDLVAPASKPETPVGDPETFPLEDPVSKHPPPGTPVMEGSETTALVPSSPPYSTVLQVSTDFRNPGLLPSYVRQNGVRRPERPSSLDLSSSCISTGKSRLNI